MKYEIICSSSKGNCVIINNFFMLDCGVSYAKIKKYLKCVKLIFISHVHTDHLNTTTMKQIAYNFPTIKFVIGSIDLANKLVNESNIDMKNIFLLKECKWYELGALKLKLEPLEHDVPNHLCKFEIKGKKGIYIVDTGSVKDINAKNYDLYLIESNYKKDLLEKHILECEDVNKLYYLDRVKRTHLSKEECDNFLISNMKETSEFCYLHKSSYNNIEVDNNE